MTSKSAPRVFVGLSGGVDSSVAALRLKQQGYEVVGVFIKVWHPDFLVCNWQQERLDAMRVAAYLDIPFLTCDAEATYRDQVASYFIEEYKAGRTPNPDVMCNKHVKFGAFLDFALDYKADFIATGHYARRVDTALGPQLHRGVDPEKDQSYFLWTLTQKQLKHTLLPIGDTIKHSIRAEATKAGLPTASKKDSQGICFLGQVDIPNFLSHYVELQPGKVEDRQGHVIGAHQGALVYTIGQRHGFTVSKNETNRTPYFVIEKDIDRNVIIVDTNRPTLTPNQHIQLHSLNLREELKLGDKLQMQTRYRQTPSVVEVTKLSQDALELSLVSNTDLPACGQSCVLYQGTLCLGGGIIA